jgi:hypothetical protein
MSPAFRAARQRFRSLILAVLASGAAGMVGDAPAAIDPQAQDPSAVEMAVWNEAQRAGTPESYQRYLELFPIGQYAEEAFRRLIERSFERQPEPRLVDVLPPLGPGAAPRTRIVAAAELALY